MRVTSLLAASAIGWAVSSAQAGVIYSVSANNVYTTDVAGANTIDFNDGTCGASVSCVGDYLITSGNLSGKYASPYGISDKYISVPEARAGSIPDKVTLTLGGDYDYYGLYWGSVDTYNSILFYLDGILVDSFSGADLNPLLANGGQTSWASNRYVNFYFTGGDLFDTVVLASTNYAFESDNHAYARVPEPGTIALLALGLLGLVVSRHQVKQH